MARAAIYARISDDRAGAGLGVARQLDDGRQLVAARGWQLPGTFVDNDTSAYSGRPRPAYRALLDSVAAGEVDVIVAWHPDRLHRSPRDLEDFIDLLDRTGATVATVTAGEVDLGSPSGRMVARIVGATARHESEHKAARIRRKHEQLAAAGKVGGGGTRPFGYEADRLTVREAEAELLREAAERIAGGASLRSVLADWERRGVRTVAGRAWHTTPLRRMLVAPRTAGLRELRGEVVGPAVWPAILDRATWERVRTILLAPDRRRAARPGATC